MTRRFVTLLLVALFGIAAAPATPAINPLLADSSIPVELRGPLLAAGEPAPVPVYSGPTITLTQGGQRALKFPRPVSRIVVSDGAVVDAVVFNDMQVRITALRTGVTSLAIFTDSNASPSATYTVRVVPDIAAIRAILAGDPELRGLRLNFDGEHAVLTGTTGNVQAHARALDVLRTYFGDKLVDGTQTAGGQMVAVEIRFAAVQADTLKELGFSFGEFGRGFSVATTGPSSVSNFSLTSAGLNLANSLPLADAFNLFLASPNSNLLSLFSLLSSAKVVSILAEPTLLVRSGDHATFLAGGEVPIPVPQAGGTGNTITIDYHPYGVRLEVAPTVLSGNRIALTVSPEVSQIDPSNALTIQGYNVPAFLRRSTSTTIELNDGQSFVLAGLIYSSSDQIESKIPGLGDLPIIGQFFRFSSNARQRQELIIVATPHLVAPIPSGTQLPPLPGEEFQRDYNPTTADMFLNRKPLDRAAAQYGLIR